MPQYYPRKGTQAQQERGQRLMKELERHPNECDLVLCSALIKAGIPANTKSPRFSQHSPLHIAAWKGFDTLVPLLLTAGIPLDAQSYHGETALMLAARHGQEKIVRALLAAGAKTEIRNDLDETALTCPANAAVVRALVSHGADINAQDHMGETALIYAAQNRNTATISALLKHGADIDVVGKYGTALACAIDRRREANAHVLIDAGANINLCTQKGSTPLALAALYGNHRLVDALLNKGADVNAQNGIALAYAAKKGRLDVIQTLLDHGADPNRRGHKKRLPETIACMHGHNTAENVLQKARITHMFKTAATQGTTKPRKIIRPKKHEPT
ncbi:MAG: ankyrin repeat domain-containing protein [Alphaproteobacteria bacterium]|nr:ankyrin repeat domain-containing protein [Alphaproteobacteria bacterium]